MVAELEKRTAEHARVEKYVAELVGELNAKAPTFRQQRELYDNAREECERLTLQVELLTGDRERLQGARDAALRELAFTRAELERYQQEHQTLTKQVERTGGQVCLGWCEISSDH